MATNHTTNYQLNLWEPGDSFLREEFNQNSQKIDAALGELAAQDRPVELGSYTGNGAAQRQFSFAFLPQALIVVEDNTMGSLLVAIRGQTTGAKAGVSYTGSNYTIAWGDTSVTLTDSRSANAGGAISNTAGASYHYIAFG